jgi:hemerythrin
MHGDGDYYDNKSRTCMERQFLIYNYPEYNEHKQFHEDFKITVGELAEKFYKNGSSAELSSDVNKTVIRWLINHIQREDKKIGEHVRSVTG